MDELNKTQLILLALLVSFITSIATGIVTVTLMDQAPPAITQTINRVVKETVKVVVPEENQEANVLQTTIVVKEEDYIVNAVQKNSDNVVRIGIMKKKGFNLGVIGESIGLGEEDVAPESSIEYVGTGLVVSKDGYMVTHGALLENSEIGGEVVIRTLNGVELRAVLLQIDSINDLALLKINLKAETNTEETEADEKKSPINIDFNSISFVDVDTLQIGQTAIFLGAQDSLFLRMGVVSKLGTDPEVEGEIDTIHTTINIDEQYSGGSLINLEGEIMGIAIVEDSNQFILPVSKIQNLLGKYLNKEEAKREDLESKEVCLNQGHLALFHIVLH